MDLPARISSPEPREAVFPRSPNHDGICLCKGLDNHQPARQPPCVTALPSPRAQPRSRVCENTSWNHQADPHAMSNSSQTAGSAESNVTFELIYLTPFTCAKKSHSMLFPILGVSKNPAHSVWSFIFTNTLHTQTHIHGNSGWEHH